MNTENGVIKDARSLGTPKMLILGLQHMFAMFGATILVPILVNSYFHGEGLSIQVTLICAGIGTLFFHFCTKMKVPAFLGSSFAFLGGFATVAELDSGIFADMSYGEKLPYACGGIVVAGLLYLVLALDHQISRCQTCHAFLTACCNRSDHYLYRFKSCTKRDCQCFYELDFSIDRSCRYYYLQYLGKRHVQDYSDSDGRCHFLCCCSHL